MPQMANRVQETTTTGGTGTITLGGAVTGYLTFASSFATSSVLFYTIDNGVGEWEIGIGTLVTTGTLSRTTVIASSNGGALVNFGSGTKRVFCSAPTRSLVPDQDSKSGYVLTTDGTDPAWTQTLNSITIGNTTPAAGAFTTLSASSTVSGTGFSTYLASPPAIGGTTPAAGAFTNLSYTGTLTGSTGIIAIGTNQIYKDASGNVGIGTSSPSRKLEVNGYFRVTDGTVQNELVNGGGVGCIGTNNNYPLAIQTNGVERAKFDTSGNLGLGVTPSGSYHFQTSTSLDNVARFNSTNSRGPQITLSRSGALTCGFGSYSAISGSGTDYTPVIFAETGLGISFIVNGNISKAMTLDASGQIQLGTTVAAGGKFKVLAGTNIAFGVEASTVVSGSVTLNAINEANTANVPLDLRCSQLYVSTGITAGAGTNALKYNTANNAFTYDTSSARYKDNIRDSVYGLGDVLQLRSAMFEYKSDGRTDVGLIAEEVFDVIPELVPLDSEGRPDAVNYDRMVSVLVRAVQELHAEIELLKAKVN